MSRYLVTGVSRGIGWAVARQLIDSGHEVIGVVRPARRALVDGVALTASWAIDMADPASFEVALADVLGTVDELHGVVHCAGIVRAGSLSSPQVAADLTAQFAVNVTAVVELTRLLLPALRAGRGTVVLVNSGSGLNARAPLAGYGASKHALRGYADALRLEEPDLRVSTIYPGRTATRMQRDVRDAENGEYRESDYLQPATVADVICTVLTLPADGVITDLTLRPR